ncbi:outer membrane beta-barrel protein [uncultured Sphingomonas sp.]|uniref:outer membrane protein n=1 Tax=uncultured Sphingomonas sp. TaxID=158754 RepID=UPI0025CDB8C9|nr:outer membrane beta-barrel protein [uncultured Sphingomonas sp.]
MIKSLLLTAATFTAITPALAQEASSWTSAYAGGRLGYSWQPKDGSERLDFDTNRDGRFGDTVRTAAGADAFSPGFCGAEGTTSLPAGGCADDKDAVTYTGMVGFDYQLPNIAGGGIVVGVVAEYGNSHVNDSVTGFSTTPANYVLTRSLRGTGAVRARAGYGFNDTLVYGTGGLAYGRVRTRFGTTNNANAFVDANGDDARQNSYKDDRWGYTVGGGVEQRIGEHFSIGALYGFTSLADGKYRLGVERGTAPATNPFLLANSTGTDLRRSHSRFVRHDVTVTAAYRF